MKLPDIFRVRQIKETATESENYYDEQLDKILKAIDALRSGDLSVRLEKLKDDKLGDIADSFNLTLSSLSTFSSEVTRLATEVGTDGNLGVQANVPGATGIWKDVTDNVNTMAGNLTSQVRDIAKVATAVSNGDLAQKITVEVDGEILELKDSINKMVDNLNAFSGEVTRVATEVGTEGKLGGQAKVPEVAGTWKDLTDNVNTMAGNLTSQVRDIAKVATAVSNGDLAQKITVEVKGEILE